MAFWKSGDSYAEFTGFPDQADKLLSISKPARMRHPLPVRIAGRVAAKSQDITDTNGRIGADHVPQLRDGVTDSGQVTDRRQRGLRGDLAGDPDRPVPRRAPGAVGDRHERRPQRLELPDREPELLLIGVGL